jgi:hypothetical protein
LPVQLLAACLAPDSPLQGAVGLAGLALLGAGSLALQTLAPALLTLGEMRADLNAGRPEVAIDDDPLARLETPQFLHRDQGPVACRLGGGHPTAGVGRVVGLGDRLIADQPRTQLQGADIRQAGQKDLGAMAVEDGGRAIPVAMHQLGLVMPHAQQLDALPTAGGRPLGQQLQSSDVPCFVEGAQQPRVQHPIR